MCDNTITIPLCEFIPLYKIILYPIVTGYVVFCTTIGFIGFREGYNHGYRLINDYKEDYDSDVDDDVDDDVDNDVDDDIMNTTFKCMNGLYYGVMTGVGSTLLAPLIMYHVYKDSH
jgi:hypothetical protein